MHSRRTVSIALEQDDQMFGMMAEQPERLENILEEREDLLGDEEENEIQDSSSIGSDNVEDEEAIPPSEFRIPLTENLNFNWGSDGKYWVMWTLWEPQVTKKLQPLTKLWQDQALPMKFDSFNDIVNRGFAKVCSDPSFKSLQSPIEMRTIVIRINLDKDVEPFHVASESIEIKASEIIFINRTVSYRFQPITLIACSGLAEILRAICKQLDILIISGTFKRMFTTKGKCVLLLNFDNPKGHLQILRLPLSDPNIIYMVEKIKPMRTVDKRYSFKYFVRGLDNRTQRQVEIHEDFKWFKTSEEFFREFSRRSENQLERFVIPIQIDQDSGEVYRLLLSKDFRLVSNQCSPMKTPARIRNPQIHRDFVSDETEESSSKDSPVFFSQSKRNYSSPSPRSDSISDRRVSSSSEPKYVRSKIRFSRSRSPRPRKSLFSPVKPSSTIFFETCGKLVVLAIVAAIFLTLLCILCTPFCYANNQSPCKVPTVISNDSKIHVAEDIDFVENNSRTVFQKMGDFIFSVGNWIREYCGFDCIMKRLGMIVINEGPVV